jgi:hypothetical protein
MPNQKDSYWFPHDCNARNDTKILAMRSVYKSEGFGWYWIIIEMLREEPSHKLPLNERTPAALAMQMQCKRSAAAKFLDDCIKTFVDSDGKGLFLTDSKNFWSESLLRRLENWDKRSEQAKRAAKVRWHGVNDANVMRTDMPMQCDSNAITEQNITEEKKTGEGVRLPLALVPGKDYELPY